jgi:pantothenate kinase type III
MIDSMIEKIILELGINPKIILTGGLSSIVLKELNINCKFIENLTLIGLEEIFNLNN